MPSMDDMPLQRTRRALREVFPDETLRPEIYRCPEGEMPPQLAIYVETPDQPRVALAKLDEFDEAFWFDHMDECGSKLSVHLEYV